MSACVFYWVVGTAIGYLIMLARAPRLLLVDFSICAVLISPRVNRSCTWPGGRPRTWGYYFEGNELKLTLSRISEGNPCAKAEQVRLIGDELGMLPDSSLVLEECCLVFELAQKEKTTQATSEERLHLES